MTAPFELRDVGMRYGPAEVLRGVTARFEGPGLAAILGPNGAGKSTLLGIMAGLREGHSGDCLFGGRDVRAWKRRAFARQVSFVPQSLRLEFPFTAGQVVMMGRTPYSDGLFESAQDHLAVEQAMALTDTLAFRERDFRSLSGGERQRVVLASALAQNPQTLLLDEPTTFLDLKHQISIYRLLRRLSTQGMLAIVVTHDLNLAAGYSDRVLMLSEGSLAADGEPGSVLTRERIAEVFGVDSEIRQGPGGRPWILYG
ncbi:MAG: ABC transporter ATP-binding protein [Acidobacteria bacterium]|nr:ABC transporter ATP-binding protein [Acidobacteriota bacterium]